LYTHHLFYDRCIRNIHEVRILDISVFWVLLLHDFSALLASCLIYAKPLRHPFRAFIEYNVDAFCFKMLPSVKFAEDKVLTFLILREKC